MRVAIAGFGTVGRSVAQLLQELAPAELQLSLIINRSAHRKRVDWIDPAVRWTDDITLFSLYEPGKVPSRQPRKIGSRRCVMHVTCIVGRGVGTSET